MRPPAKVQALMQRVRVRPLQVTCIARMDGAVLDVRDFHTGWQR